MMTRFHVPATASTSLTTPSPYGRIVTIARSYKDAVKRPYRVSPIDTCEIGIAAKACRPPEETVIIECKGGYTVTIHRKLLCRKSLFFADESLCSKQQTASGMSVIRTSLPRRSLKRYKLWLHGSGDFAMFDPSLTAPELLLELSDLHIAAEMLQDQGFANEVMDVMVSHLTRRSDEMLPQEFLARFLQTNARDSTGRKLIVDWIAWSMPVSDSEVKKLLKQVQDANFAYAVAKAVLRKTCREWEGNFVPPYMVSPDLYHAHSEAGRTCCKI